MEIRDIFRQRLKERRLANLMTQEELAEKTDIQGPLICLYETGKKTPRSVNLKRLCQALDCSADYLLGLSDEIVRRKQNDSE